MELCAQICPYETVMIYWKRGESSWLILLRLNVRIIHGCTSISPKLTPAEPITASKLKLIHLLYWSTLGSNATLWHFILQSRETHTSLFHNTVLSARSDQLVIDVLNLTTAQLTLSCFYSSSSSIHSAVFLQGLITSHHCNLLAIHLM